MKTKVLPCPLCLGEPPLYPEEMRNRRKKGGKGWIYWGHLSASTMGVSCSRCRLSISEDVFESDRWPKGVKRTYRALEEWCLERAVRRWNALPRKGD